MIRMMLEDYRKEVGFGLEFQINEVHCWSEELQLWEKTYNLIAYWEKKKRFKKLEYRAISLFGSTDKDIIIKLFNLIQKPEDLTKGIQVFRSYINSEEEL